MKYLVISYSLFIAIILSSLQSTYVYAEENIPRRPVEIGLQLLTINQQKVFSINFKNYPEWHTYWENPGDAGLAIENKFYIDNKEINLIKNKLPWPIPQKFIEQGNQWAFGYTGEYSLFYLLDSQFQNKYFGKKITLKSKWLVCKNLCIPGAKEIQFTLSRNGLVANTPELLTDINNDILSDRFNRLPKAKNLPDYVTIELFKGEAEKTLELRYIIKNTTDTQFISKTNLMFPYPVKPFDIGHENIATTENSLVGSAVISWDGEYQNPPEPLSPNGKFKRPYTLSFLINDPISHETYIIEKKFSNFELTKKNIDNLKTVVFEEKKNDNFPLDQTEKKLTETPPSSLFYYLILAFIGGLILNAMPCVLPVISLKLFGLIKYQQESKKRILKHNILYTLGILSTFITLAAIIIILKQFGTVVGWGFQLQSPNFIAIMIIILFIFSLNLFGLFEFITPGGSKLGNIQTDDDFWGDFLGGVLATILSTPCSAPFLGTALTFAFTAGSFTIFSIFMMIGLGLASPFILTGFFPNLVSFLPKPGNWMNTLKKVLGVTLILTIFWLLDVYNTLVNGQSHLIKLFTLLFLIFVGFIIQKKEKWIARVAFLLSLLILINIFNTELMVAKENESSLIRDKQAKGLNWEAWSIEKMEEYKTNRQIVFIDFTAKWCFTCKVNERLVLDTEDFKNFVKENNIQLLIADWTKRDEVIGDFLMKNNMVGVPAYFIQKADGSLINLGETISIQKIRANL